MNSSLGGEQNAVMTHRFYRKHLPKSRLLSTGRYELTYYSPFQPSSFRQPYSWHNEVCSDCNGRARVYHGQCNYAQLSSCSFAQSALWRNGPPISLIEDDKRIKGCVPTNIVFPMSRIRAPGLQIFMDSSRHSRVVLMSLFESSSISPTGYVALTSP